MKTYVELKKQDHGNMILLFENGSVQAPFEMITWEESSRYFKVLMNGDRDFIEFRRDDLIMVIDDKNEVIIINENRGDE